MLLLTGHHIVPRPTIANLFCSKIQVKKSLIVYNRASQHEAPEYSFEEAVSREEASRLEKIAASLVSRLKSLPQEVDDYSDSTPDEELLRDLEAGQANQVVERETASVSEASPRTTSNPTKHYRLRRRGNIPTEALPKVVIVGRPNVGKSALFNRIAGASLAVVYDTPGITRDRQYTRAFWGDKDFVLIDTGGLTSTSADLPPSIVNPTEVHETSGDKLPAAIERQVATGVAEADVIVLLTDGQVGLQPGDVEVMSWLRTTYPSKYVLLAVNKCDTPYKADLMASDFWSMGLTPLPLSAISGSGTGELLDELIRVLPPPRWNPDDGNDASKEDQELAVAILGRPNVGKSSLLNAICGEERFVVCDLSGTTRDAVDTVITTDAGERLRLIDTAGIRRRARVADSADGSEPLSVEHALRAVRKADVAVLVIDGTERVTQQDFRLADMISKEGRAVVLVVNKWDLVDKKLWDTGRMIEDVKAQLRQVEWANVVCTCANQGKRVDDVVAAVLKAGIEHRRRVSTATLNMVLREAASWRAPPGIRGAGKKGKIYYVTQAGVAPPAFVFFVNDPKLFPIEYRRYIERQLRDNIGFPGTPLRLLWRGKEGGDNKRVVEVRSPPPASKPSSQPKAKSNRAIKGGASPPPGARGMAGAGSARAGQSAGRRMAGPAGGRGGKTSSRTGMGGGGRRGK